jgi:hypothetical protein
MDINGCSVTQIQCHCFLEETSLLGDELTASCTPKCCCSFRALPFWGSHLPRPLVTRGGDGFCQPALLAYACWILSQNGRIQEKWDEMSSSFMLSFNYIYIFYINIYDYIVANHRIICSMYSNHKDQFITTLWTCLYSFLSSGLEVAAEFGWSKWPRCCGHLGSGATEDPGIFGNVGSAEFLQPFLGSFEFYPWQSKFPGSMKLRIDRGSSAYSLWVSGSIPGPSEVCNGRRIDLQADLSSAGNRSASANNRSSPDTEQHLRNYLSTSKSHFHIWTPIWSYLRFRLGSTSGYYLIQCDKPNKPSPSPCLWVLC